MAQVTQDVQATTEYLLDYLLPIWQDIPWVARQWPDWTWTDKEVFTVEWSLKEERFQELHAYAAQNLLTDAQRARFDTLLWLVNENRPALERLLRE